MNPDKRLIEYYFFHYDEHFETCSKKLATFRASMFPYNSALLYDSEDDFTSTEILNVIMGRVVRKTYQHFREKKRHIIKDRYFLKHKRDVTCKKLDISPRTYHRYLDEILQFASEYLQVLLTERMEYQRDLKFFQSRSQVAPPQIHEYFSNHTFEI